MRWIWLALAGVCIALIGPVVWVAAPYVEAAWPSPLDPPTPPLLEGAEAAGGWWNGGCAPDPELQKFQRNSPEALSPTIERNLLREFPPGTPEANLRRSLITQGFEFDAPCREDQSIHRARFVQRGGGFFGPYPAAAEIAWKVDARDKIVWTKGNVGYLGP